MKKVSGFGISGKDSADLIVQECLNNGVTDKRQIAYILGTAQHETGNFTQSHEVQGASQARRLGYEGGATYAGRGYVQLTHRSNYERMDKALGLNGALVRNPDLAARPDIAAKILVVGMRDGMFTGKPLGNYINDDVADALGARKVVNGVLKSRPETVEAAQRCMQYATKWEGKLGGIMDRCIPDAGPPLRPMKATRLGTADIRMAQAMLGALGVTDERGMPLQTDGIPGPHTRFAVVKFQEANGLKPTGNLNRETVRELSHEFDGIRKRDFSMVDSIREKLHAIETGIGKKWDQASENVSAALGFAAKKLGLDRVDAVELSKDMLKVAAIKGNPAGPAAALAYVVVKDGMKIPAEASLLDMHTLGQLGKNVAKDYADLMIPTPVKRLVH